MKFIEVFVMDNWLDKMVFWIKNVEIIIEDVCKVVVEGCEFGLFVFFFLVEFIIVDLFMSSSVI